MSWGNRWPISGIGDLNLDFFWRNYLSISHPRCGCRCLRTQKHNLWMYAAKSSLALAFSECITQSWVFTQISLTVKLAPLWRIRDSRILFTNQYASSVEVSISDAPKLNFQMYAAISLLFHRIMICIMEKLSFSRYSFILKPHRPELVSWLSSGNVLRSPPNPLSDRRKSLPDDSDIAPHGLRYAHLASRWLAERL